MHRFHVNIYLNPINQLAIPRVHLSLFKNSMLTSRGLKFHWGLSTLLDPWIATDRFVSAICLSNIQTLQPTRSFHQRSILSNVKMTFLIFLDGKFSRKKVVSGGFGKNSLISVGLSPFKSVISCFHVPLSAPTISVDVFLSFFFSGIKTGFLVPSLTLIFPSFKFNLTTRGLRLWTSLGNSGPTWRFQWPSNPILQQLQHHRR